MGHFIAQYDILAPESALAGARTHWHPWYTEIDFAFPLRIPLNKVPGQTRVKTRSPPLARRARSALHAISIAGMHACMYTRARGREPLTHRVTAQFRRSSAGAKLLQLKMGHFFGKIPNNGYPFCKMTLKDGSLFKKIPNNGYPFCQNDP